MRLFSYGGYHVSNCRNWKWRIEPNKDPREKSETFNEIGFKIETPLLDQLIPDAAVNIFESTRNFEDLIKEVEKPDNCVPNYPVLKSAINKAIDGMENARYKYEEIVKISSGLEMDMVFKKKLIEFDYEGFRAKHQLNQLIFDKTAVFCKIGDVTRIYKHTYHTILAIHENLNHCKKILEKETLPDLYIIWETGQLYYEFEIFVDYISRIFYEINREVRGENLKQ